MSEVRLDETFGGRTLRVGHTYRLTMQDCCIEGHFVGQYLGVRYTENDSRHHPGVFDYPTTAVFTTGEIGPDWGQWTAVEI